jgi:hypothetical protein
MCKARSRPDTDIVPPDTDVLIDKVRELFESVGSLDALRDELVAFAPKPPVADLANALGQGAGYG